MSAGSASSAPKGRALSVTANASPTDATAQLRPLVGVARIVGQARDGGGFWGDGDEIVAAKLLHVVVAQRLGERRDLEAHALEETVDVLGFDRRVVAFLVLGVLGGDAGHALAHMALHAGDAAAGDDRRPADGRRIRAQTQRLD